MTIFMNSANRVCAFGAVAIIVSAVAGYSTAGYAVETKTVQRTVTVYSLDDAPALKTAVTAICADKALKLSDKARAACDSKQFPAITKALQFRNSGIGAEFNALARQRGG
jgi:hypothetical protein